MGQTGKASARLGKHFWGRALLGRQRLSARAAAYKDDQRGPRVKPISEIATSNGLFRPVFQGKIDTANLTFGDASHVDWSWAPPAEVRRPPSA